jgi:hypothetical protein
MNYPALIISSLALLFTILSFWWMNWRRGSLRIGTPRSYAAKGSIDENLIITLPFVFYNNGASAIIVQNLRLLLLNEQSNAKPLFFNATLERLLKDEGRAFATQFPVRGREAVTIICEFQRKPGDLLFEKGSYPIELQAILNENHKWQTLCRFDLNVKQESLSSINKQYIAHDNHDA